MVAWNEAGHASVWAWDRAQLAEAFAEARRPLRAVPESALHEPLEDGLRLLVGLDGFEAQQWASGELIASRWWRERPDAMAQLAFQRDCGLSSEAQLPDLPVVDSPLAPRPWMRLAPLGAANGLLAPAELLGYAALALALGVPTLALGVDAVRLHRAKASVDEQLATVAAQSQGALAMRERAFSAADQARALAELQPLPGPLVHMLAIARSLPEGSGSTLREWEQAEGRLRLLIDVGTQDASGAEYVRALEQTGLFSDVKLLTQANPRQIGFSMSIKPQSALAPASAGSR
jgi:hypothetical protein